MNGTSHQLPFVDPLISLSLITATSKTNDVNSKHKQIIQPSPFRVLQMIIQSKFDGYDELLVLC